MSCKDFKKDVEVEMTANPHLQKDLRTVTTTVLSNRLKKRNEKTVLTSRAS